MLKGIHSMQNSDPKTKLFLKFRRVDKFKLKIKLNHATEHLY